MRKTFWLMAAVVTMFTACEKGILDKEEESKRRVTLFSTSLLM